mmetsp:Transcript_53290/g.159576  ORF Transcript_53290/g.159576 Transcript_53290/m.159576 type:complete len:303 (-) Transcript_53290:2010-2918(-)
MGTDGKKGGSLAYSETITQLVQDVLAPILALPGISPRRVPKDRLRLLPADNLQNYGMVRDAHLVEHPTSPLLDRRLAGVIPHHLDDKRRSSALGQCHPPPLAPPAQAVQRCQGALHDADVVDVLPRPVHDCPRSPRLPYHALHLLLSRSLLCASRERPQRLAPRTLHPRPGAVQLHAGDDGGDSAGPSGGHAVVLVPVAEVAEGEARRGLDGRPVDSPGHKGDDDGYAPGRGDGSSVSLGRVDCGGGGAAVTPAVPTPGRGGEGRRRGSHGELPQLGDDRDGLLLGEGVDVVSQCHDVHHGR